MKAFIVFFLFTSAPAFGLDVKFHKNVPAEIKESAQDALNWMQNIEFSKTSPIHKKFFGKALSGQSYVDYFSKVKLIDYIEVDDDMTAAKVYGGQPIVHLTQNFLTSNEKWVDHISVFIHEVRHIKNNEGRFSHVKCPSHSYNEEPLVGHVSGKSLENLRACDSSPKGAYAYQIIMLSNIARYCVNCEVNIKERAAFVSQQLLERIVNNKSAYEALKADMGPHL